MNALLKNKVCLVTGAGRGIGKAIAQLYAQHGATVYCNATSSDSLNWIKDQGSPNLVALPFDITDPAACRSALLTIRKEATKIDVLVNNAGVEYNELIGLFNTEHRDHMFAVNVYAPMELIQLAARIMGREKSGSIINITSKVGIYGNPGQLVYSATKGALIALTKSAAKELAPNGIRVNAVAPGLTKTEMMEQADPSQMEDRIHRIGMGRLAEPSDIAGTCLFLASDLSTYLTGQVIEVEGSTIM